MKTSDVLLIGALAAGAYFLTRRSDDDGAPGLTPGPLWNWTPAASSETVNIIINKDAVTTRDDKLGIIVAPPGSKLSTIDGPRTVGGGGGGYTWSQNPVIQKAVTQPGGLGQAIGSVFTKPTTSPAMRIQTSNPASVSNALSTVFKRKI
jgi:hypothetical protein